MIRRALDVLVAGGALVVSAPLLALAIVAIRLESPGPAIYRQRRAGLRGGEFDVLKLRTMVQGAEHMGAGLAINHDDDRITRVGALLRRTSLDELPQLVNILRGDMSIIGPRPTLPVQVRQYTPRQRGRLAIKPGITGWAQVNGRTALPWSERIELDLWYIEHRSLALDLRILWRTVAVVLGGEDLYKGQTGGWQPDAGPHPAGGATAGPGDGPPGPSHAGEPASVDAADGGQVGGAAADGTSATPPAGWGPAPGERAS